MDRKLDPLVTMPVLEDAQGKFIVGVAIAFKLNGQEGVLIASSLSGLKKLHDGLMFDFEADWSKARRVQVRNITPIVKPKKESKS